MLESGPSCSYKLASDFRAHQAADADSRLQEAVAAIQERQQREAAAAEPADQRAAA